MHSLGDHKDPCITYPCLFLEGAQLLDCLSLLDRDDIQLHCILHNCTPPLNRHCLHDMPMHYIITHTNHKGMHQHAVQKCIQGRGEGGVANTLQTNVLIWSVTPWTELITKSWLLEKGKLHCNPLAGCGKSPSLPLYVAINPSFLNFMHDFTVTSLTVFTSNECSLVHVQLLPQDTGPLTQDLIMHAPWGCVKLISCHKLQLTCHWQYQDGPLPR